MTRPKRIDQTPGNRGAYENARRKILATQDICGICGKPVDKTIRYPHPMSASVDHIIPVSRGGHPSDINNLQLAHRCCNRAKSDKLMVGTHPPGSSPSPGAGRIVSNRLLEQHADWCNFK